MAGKSPTRMEACYLDDSILLSETHAWTYVSIPLVSYEFLTDEERQDLAIRMSVALAQLVTNNQAAVDVHLIVTHRLLDVPEWKEQLSERVDPLRPAPVWKGYLERMSDRLERIGFTRKEVYLGVCLGPRKGKGSVRTGKSDKASKDTFFSPFTKLVNGLSRKAGIEDPVIPESELAEWRKRADDARRVLRQGALHATPASSDDVAWLISKSLYPAPLTQPDPTSNPTKAWGKGDLRQLAEGVVTNHYRWLEIEQFTADGELETGYMATLAVSRFPDVLHFPSNEPWMHFAESMLVPSVANWSTRMSIVPPMKVQKDVGKKLADAKDQAQHIAETGAGVPLKVREQLEVATALEYQIDKDRNPWAYARHRITVTGSTAQEVTDQAKTLIERYRELNIDIVWPSGDQFELMLESMPGDKVRSNAYYQRQELNVVSGGMPTASSDCGDKIDYTKNGQQGWEGPYIGATNSRVLQPVFFSPHVAMAKNNPPGVAITGSPGGGKALALDTPIPTPRGYIPMGDLVVGDIVYDEKGRKTEVIEVHPVLENHPCFEVVFIDSVSGRVTDTIVADAEHLWPVELSDGAIGAVSTEELYFAQQYPDSLPLKYSGTATLPSGAKIEHVISSITPVESRPVRCIRVAAESHLFLAGVGCVPTHNTFLAFTLAYQMAASGVWTIYIDPKADAKPMGSLPGLGSPRVFDLRDGNDGMLDPFSMGSSPAESKLLALETLRLLLGGNVSEDREEALLNAIEVVGASAKPSLGAVVEQLLASDTTGARNVGAVLKTIRSLPFARLCFSATGGNELRPEDGLTVVTLLGLDLPNATTSPDDYSYENRLAVSVMYLLTRYARQLMLSMNKNHPKAICIDEAWAITQTPQGAKLIPEIARMGRSHNTALVLVSQNAKDLMEESVTNSLSTKFAFRSSIPAEVDAVMDLFGLPKTEGFQGYVKSLGNGQCLMQDVDGRVAPIQIDNWDKQLFEAFDTNPETRGKKVLQ